MPLTTRTIEAGLVRRSAVALLAAASVTAAHAQASATDLDESWWAAIGPDGVQRVNIRCGPDFLDPRSIVVRANVPLQLSVSTTADLVSNNFTIAMGATTIDAPVRAAPTSFGVLPGPRGRFQAVCHDKAKPDSPAIRRARTATIIVLP
jgi:hypothetical protein